MFVIKFSSVFGALMLVSLFEFNSATPKKYNPQDGGFEPSNNRYYESPLSSLSSRPVNLTNKSDLKESKESDRLRFGIPISSYGNTGAGVQGYPNNGVGYMISPMKIDIGGIALGALIGLGAILIVPKLASVFSGGHGYRNLENDMTAVQQILSKIDNSLEQHNIDSSSCIQRVICSYVTDAKKNILNGEANTLDEFIYGVSNNSLLSYMIDGTAVKEAVEMGKQGDTEKCNSLNSKCPITRENITKVIASLLPA